MTRFNVYDISKYPNFAVAWEPKSRSLNSRILLLYKTGLSDMKTPN
jgi:hypothetical protein